MLISLMQAIRAAVLLAVRSARRSLTALRDFRGGLLCQCVIVSPLLFLPLGQAVGFTDQPGMVRPIRSDGSAAFDTAGRPARLLASPIVLRIALPVQLRP
jgi:hypothetical protein